MKFSVVIPTLNRASLLGNALRSALDQKGTSHEVLVSNNHSTDETESVVRSLSAPNLRYVETNRTLSMVDHWEFALTQTKGDWVLLLCDDDSLVPGALSYLAELADAHPETEVMRYRKAVYCYDDGTEARGNYIHFRKSRKEKVRKIESRKILEGVLGKLGGHGPRYLNCAVRRTLVERIRDRHGRAFHEWAPDLSGGALLLANTSHFLDISRILMLWGKNLRSYGSGAAVDPAHLRRFLEQFESFSGRLEHTPYPELLTVSNMVLDTLERTRSLLGEEGRRIELDRVPYLQSLLADLVRYVEHGHEEFREPIARVKQDLEARLPPATGMRRFRKGLRKRLKSIRWRRGLLGSRARDIASPYRGREFHNIYEAAQVFGELQST